jgi:hypothetical protein
VLQLVVPVVRQPQKPRADFYTVLLAADCVVSVSQQTLELRLTNRKHILGTMDTADESSGADEMRAWVAALRSAGPQWRESLATSPPDASGWLLVREKTLGVSSWSSRWCELRGSELLHFEGDGDIRSGLIDLRQFTLFTPKMPDAHKPFEFVFLGNKHAGGPPTAAAAAGGTPFSTPTGSSKKMKRRGSVDSDGLPFHCLCAQDEAAYSAWQAALNKVATIASAHQSRGLAARIGIGTGLWGTPLSHGSSSSSSSSSSASAAAAVETRVSQEDFEVDSLLGEGAFGKVWLVRPKEHLGAAAAAAAASTGVGVAPGTPSTPGNRGADVEAEAEAVGEAEAEGAAWPQQAEGHSKGWMAMKVMAKSRVIAEQQVEHVQQERKLLQRLGARSLSRGNERNHETLQLFLLRARAPFSYLHLHH